jgi:hypothetical protein
MPAIQPARLRRQAANLAAFFDRPELFVRHMHTLLDFYSDRARRQGQSGRPGPLIQAYHMRPPVLRALLQELLAPAEANPPAALRLCDALWGEDFLEFRQLAAMLLGQLPTSVHDGVVERLRAWIMPNLELHLIELLLSTGVERLYREQPRLLLNLISTWLDQNNPFYQQLGLHALLPLIRDPNFENIPVFYRLVQPFTRNAPSGLRPDVLDIVEALAQRAPQETAYFLRQMLIHPDAPDTPWLIRQSLKAFPEDAAEGLRQAVRATRV